MLVSFILAAFGYFLGFYLFPAIYFFGFRNLSAIYFFGFYHFWLNYLFGYYLLSTFVGERKIEVWTYMAMSSR